MWEVLRDRTPVFLQNKIALSPLNNIESIRVNKETGKCTINYLKGSWNLALQAEGWTQADPRIKEDLNAAILNNPFLKKGYDLLKGPSRPTSIIRVPRDYPTIQAAIDAAKKGDTILVSAGTYNEAINLNKSGISLVGVLVNALQATGNEESSVINGPFGLPAITCLDLSGGLKTKITGFTIRGSFSSNSNYNYTIKCMGTVNLLEIENNFLPLSGIELENGASVVIKNNKIDNYSSIKARGNNYVQIIGNSFNKTINKAPPLPVSIYLNSTTGLLKDNYITDRYGCALHISNGSNINIINNIFDKCIEYTGFSGVMIRDSIVTLRNNLFKNNEAHAGGHSCGVDAMNSNVYLYNNIFFGNYIFTTANYFDGGVAAYIINSNFTAKNNIFLNNAGMRGVATIYVDGSGTQDFSYNLFWNNRVSQSTSGVTLGPGNISIDPKFVSETDFHLQSGSPCINAGDPATQYSDWDGSTNDMGIYGGPNPY